MKTVTLVFAILLLVGSAAIGVIGSNKARDLAGKASEAAAMVEKLPEAQRAMVEKEAGEIPSSGRLKIGSYVAIFGGLAALMVILALLSRKQDVPKGVPVAVLLTTVSALIYPFVQTGPMDGLAPRPQALVAAGLALVGGLLAVVAARKPAQR